MVRTDLQDIPGHEGFAVALIVSAICIACTVGASAWQGRYALPASYARAESSPAIIKEPDRLPVHPVQTVKYRLDPAATVHWAPMPWTCAEIRAYAKNHTEAEMHAKANEHKLTPQQRAIAKACLEARR